MTRVAVAAVILSGATPLARAQSPRESATSTAGDTTITGRVVADETGNPIPNARVSLAIGELGIPVVLTDGDGRFVLPAPAGRANVVFASKSGYARHDVTLTADESVEIRLRRGAAISGRVIDEFGDPAPAIRVMAEAPSSSSGTSWQDPEFLSLQLPAR